MTEPTNIERAVMRRIHRIHRMEFFFSGTALAILLGILALWGIGREVWVARVLENGPQDFVGKVEYLSYAFLHTRLLVQALSVVTVGALVYLARETARLFARSLAPALS